MKRVQLLAASALLACGSVQTGDDASMKNDAAVDGPDDASLDQGTADGGHDDGPEWWFVDGGRECGIPDVGPCHTATIYSCCNGMLCAGECIQFAKDPMPQCYCTAASLAGGCPNGTVCCGTGIGCVQQMSCGTIGPPPPNCN